MKVTLNGNLVASIVSLSLAGVPQPQAGTMDNNPLNTCFKQTKDGSTCSVLKEIAKLLPEDRNMVIQISRSPKELQLNEVGPQIPANLSKLAEEYRILKIDCFHILRRLDIQATNFGRINKFALTEIQKSALDLATKLPDCSELVALKENIILRVLQNEQIPVKPSEFQEWCKILYSAVNNTFPEGEESELSARTLNEIKRRLINTHNIILDDAEFKKLDTTFKEQIARELLNLGLLISPRSIAPDIRSKLNNTPVEDNILLMQELAQKLLEAVKAKSTQFK